MVKAAVHKRRSSVDSASARRALEELAAHQLLTFRKDGDSETSPILWQATAEAREYWNKLARNRLAKP